MPRPRLRRQRRARPAALPADLGAAPPGAVAPASPIPPARGERGDPPPPGPPGGILGGKLESGPGRGPFTARDRLGRWPVLEDGGPGCRRTLPCFVGTADRAHVLVVDRIYALPGEEMVRDLSGVPAWGRFVDAAIEQLGFRRRDAPHALTPVRYALSNDLRFVVAYPYTNRCVPGEAQRRFNAVVVYETESGRSRTYLGRETADAGLQPVDHAQHVYFDGDAVHLVSRYGHRARGGGDAHLGCEEASRVLDFEATSGRNRPLGAGASLRGGEPSRNGKSRFGYSIDFDAGVVVLDEYDIPVDRAVRRRLALPGATLEQTSSRRVRRGAVDGEFVRR